MRTLTQLLVLTMFVASSLEAQDGIAGLRSGHQPQVLVLGTFHFEDAGLDGYTPTFPFDIRTPARQRELEDVIAKLAAWKPTRIAVEASPAGQAKLDSLFRVYPGGGLDTVSDETYQIGFRLARRLGLGGVTAIDARARSLDSAMAEAEWSRREAALTRGPLSATDWDARFETLYRQEDSLKALRSLRATLEHLNSPEKLRADHGHYLVGNLLNGRIGDYFGADGFVSAWYNRNIRIYSNIARLVRHEDERVLVIIGTGHVPILRELMLSSPALQFVSATDVLRSSPEVKPTLTRILAHAESASVYRQRVDWPATRAEVLRLADTATTVPSLAPALRHLLRTMGDDHARVIHGGRAIAYHYGPSKPHLARFDSELNNKIQSATAYPFRASLLGGDVGYVRIVGLPMGDNTVMAKAIETEVCRLTKEGATRWILDLRYNGGGNLNPMAEGIAAILGDGPVGGWKGLTSREDGAWSITRGDFVNAGYSVALPNSCRMPGDSKVAVLAGVHTASSGEALAVMFKGRANTRFFGGKTLGMITVTDWTVLDDLTALTISVGYYADRTGRVYDQFVDVDEEVAFSPTESLESDAGVQRALSWLQRR